jgi:hypothetical protein
MAGHAVAWLVEALCFNSEGRWFETQWGQWISSMYLDFPLSPGVYSAYKRNERQKQKRMFFGSREQPTCKADNHTAICELIV